MGDKLREAIATAYKRQQELIAERDKYEAIVTGSIKGKIPDMLGWAIIDSIQGHYHLSISEVTNEIKILEALRDAS